jgi:hypothetical protein
MNSRQRFIAIAFLQFAALLFTSIGASYAGYQFELSALSADGPGYRPSFIEYLAESISESGGSLFLFEFVLTLLLYTPPTLAAFRMSNWVKFQTIALVIALILAIVSLLQMLSWEVGSQNGCTGCMVPGFLQLLFSFFVFIAATYRSVFHRDFENQ